MLYIFRNVLVIQKINFFFEGQKINVNYQTDHLIGKTLLFNDVDNLPINNTILYNDQQAYQVKNIYKILPDILHINLEKQAPVYQLVLADQFYLVDDFGKARKINQAQDNLAEIFINQDFFVLENQISSKTHQFLEQVVEALQFVNFKKIVYKNNTEIIIYLDDGKQITLAENNLVIANISRLKILLDNFDWGSEGSNKDKLDLRFKFPVLK